MVMTLFIGSISKEIKKHLYILNDKSNYDLLAELIK
jgi:hypothetical protein